MALNPLNLTFKFLLVTKDGHFLSRAFLQLQAATREQAVEIANDLGFPSALGPDGLLRFFLGILPARFAAECDKMFRARYFRYKQGLVRRDLKHYM